MGLANCREEWVCDLWRNSLHKKRDEGQLHPYMRGIRQATGTPYPGCLAVVSILLPMHGTVGPRARRSMHEIVII
jgi:hypothetical protein